MALSPLINGRRYSYSSIEVVLQNGAGPPQLYTDISSVSYEEDLDVSFVRGTSRSPIGWTAGDYNPGDSSFEMGKSSFTQLVLTTGPGWLGINMVANIAYADIGEIVTVDTLIARIIGAADSHTTGPDALKTTLKIKPITILRNGIPSMLNRVF
jgi:hypothetical protein